MLKLAPRQLAVRVVRSLVPPLFLILVVLGSIFFGIATPTEAGAAGAELRARPRPNKNSDGQAGKERVAVLACFERRT